MSSLLRSTKFVRYFTGAARTLILNSVKTAEASAFLNSKALSAANNVFVRDYATTKKTESLDPLLQKLDSEVRRYGRITKRDIDEVLDEIQSKNDITSSQSLLVIRCCGELVPEELPEQRTLLVQKIWSVLTERGIAMDISHYNALLRVYIENQHPFSPAQFLTELENKGLQPNRVTYQRLMWRYCQEGDVEGATKVLEKMRELSMPVSEPVLNALVMGHAFHGDTEGAKAVLETMAGAGLQPSNRTYTLLACGYAKQGDIEGVEGILQLANEKDAYITDKDILDIIEHLAIGGHEDKVENLFKHLQKSIGYNQDVCNLILRLLNKGLDETAKKIFATMPKSSHFEDNLFKGAFFVKHLLRLNRSPDSIIKTCKDLTHEGLVPNAIYIATEGALQSGNCELAQKLFKELVNEGKEVRQHYYWPLLVKKGKEKDEEGLLQILRDMSTNNIPASGETLRDYVIPYLTTNSNAQSVIVKLQIANVPVIHAARNVMIHLLELGRINEASEIALQYRPRGQYNLVGRPLVNALYKSKDINSFINILHVISSKPPLQSEQDSTTDEAQNDSKNEIRDIGRIIKSAVKSLPKNESEGILEAAYAKGLSIDIETAEGIQQYLGENMTTKVSQLLSELSSSQLEPVPIESPRRTEQANDRSALEIESIIARLKEKGTNVNRLQKQLLCAYINEKNIEKVKSFLSELRLSNFELNTAILAQLFEFLCENDEIELAKEIRTEIESKNEDFILSRLKLIQMAQALFRTNRYDEAIQFLIENKFSDAENVGFLVNSKCWQILNSLAEQKDCEKVKEVTKTLLENNYVQASNVLFGPTIKAYLLNNDVQGALVEFEKCCKQYRCTPWKGELMKALIMKEDANQLQWLADLSTQIHGEVNILHDLVLAFVECGRLRQARRILETPGLQARHRRLDDACQRYVEVRARDFGEPSLSSTVPVTIYVQDVNDHAPMFQQIMYKRSIPEDMPGGTSVLDVKARDADGSSPNNRIVYRIQRGASDKFVIDSRTGVVSVANGSTLDPDKTNPKSTHYTLTVVALDGGIGDQQLSAAVLVNITIVDVNNKPPVLVEPGSVVVRENIQVGTEIYRAKAFDLDDQPVLRFGIDKANSVARNEDGIPISINEYDFLNLWDLNAVDGTLRVVRLLDREKIETFKLVITVEDMAALDVGPRQTATGTLTVTVDDENDNNPVFRKPFYKTSITENSKNGVNIVNVIADDADRNRTMVYFVEGREEYLNMVHMESTTGELVVANKIDHELYPWINLTVKAVDSGIPPRYSVVDLVIQVLDENDNNPVFESSAFEYRVREDAEPGTVIAVVSARDADSGENGKITYLLDRTSTQGKFLINGDTGALTISDWLDRESQATYNLVVEAWDNYQFGYLSGESRNAFKQIVVHVEDVNDNPPILHVPPDCTTITEFHNHREPIVSVSASDADDNSTPNGRVQFHLVAGKGQDLFRFEQVGGDANTGRLFARQSLKDRFGNYTLIVEARDLGTPANAVRGELRVCVTDYNDHAPVFVHPQQNVTIKVPENATIGTTIIEAKAIDADIGPNGAVRYRLRRDAGGSWRAFSLHATSGALRTLIPLDRDKQTTYQLRIEAYDLGLPTPLSSDLDLTVYVQNVDNYRPRFPFKSFSLNVTENDRSESVFLPSVIERDAIDRGDEPVLPVCYYIVNGNDDDAFHLHKTTHKLTTLKPLDREQKSNYTLTILATEDCVKIPQYTSDLDYVSTLTVHITVNDVNDNAPKFLRKIFTGGITTKADFGIEFMQVQAIDIDDGDNAKISYYQIGDIKQTLTEGLENLAVLPFLVNPETGAVSLNFDPQKGMKGYFDFQVLANDTGGLQDEAHVFIYLLREDQRVRFVLRAHPSEVRDRINGFREHLARVTGSVVNVDDLRVHENKDGSVDNTKTDLYLHLVNGRDHSVLEVSQVLKIVDENIEYLDELFKEFNVLDTQPAEYQPLTAETMASNQTVFWLVWTTLFLAVLLVLAIMMCVSQRADYVRRLKAATATAYSSAIPGESDMTIRSTGGRVPNTNKHSTKGSNPIWLHAYENDWYKSDDQLSRSERDSLDENAVDQDLSNEKPYFITTAAFPSIDSNVTEPQTNQANSDLYQQLEQLKNAKNMETTEL